MSEINLRYLKLSDEKQFYSALNEPWEEEFGFLHYWDTIAEKNFSKYVSVLPEFAKGKLIPEEHVPATFLFAFDKDNKIVGRTSIRHSLNEPLLKIGGHVGYGVVPSQRRKGYATQILKESLKYIQLNLPSLERVLVTCDEGNIGSQKTIEKNNGQLENIIEFENSPAKRRYWITFS